MSHFSAPKILQIYHHSSLDIVVEYNIFVISTIYTWNFIFIIIKTFTCVMQTRHWRVELWIITKLFFHSQLRITTTQLASLLLPYISLNFYGTWGVHDVFLRKIEKFPHECYELLSVRCYNIFLSSSKWNSQQVNLIHELIVETRERFKVLTTQQQDRCKIYESHRAITYQFHRWNPCKTAAEQWKISSIFAMNPL